MIHADKQISKTNPLWRWAKQFIEQAGIHIFFISLILFTQIKWIKKYSKYTQLEARLFAVFIIGMIISLGIIELIKKMAVRTGKDHDTLLKNISIALSPGIFFIFASANKVFLIIGLVLCALTGLYIWVKPFRDFVKYIIYVDKFKNTLIINNNNASIKISGVYEKADLQTIQSFLIDLAKNFHECAEMKIEYVKIDLSDIREIDLHELKSLIEPVAIYFNLRIAY